MTVCQLWYLHPKPYLGVGFTTESMENLFFIPLCVPRCPLWLILLWLAWLSGCGPPNGALSSAWLLFEGVPQLDAGNPIEVIRVAGDQLKIVLQGRGGDDGISEAHFSLLAQRYGTVRNRERDFHVEPGSKEGLQILFVSICQSVIAENFDPGRYGYRTGERLQQLLEPLERCLPGIDDDIAVQQVHGSSRPGSERSLRISRCHAAGS